MRTLCRTSWCHGSQLPQTATKRMLRIGGRPGNGVRHTLVRGVRGDEGGRTRSDRISPFVSDRRRPIRDKDENVSWAKRDVWAVAFPHLLGKSHCVPYGRSVALR